MLKILLSIIKTKCLFHGFNLKSVFLLLLPFCALASNPGITSPTLVNSETVVNLMLNNPDVVIVDVRSHYEFVKGHIQDAINISASEIISQDHVSNKTTPIIFYCGGYKWLRSETAAKKHIEYGYKNIYWFKGGLREWTSRAMPVSLI